MDVKVFDRNIEAKEFLFSIHKTQTDLDWPVQPIKL